MRIFYKNTLTRTGHKDLDPGGTSSFSRSVAIHHLLTSHTWKAQKPLILYASYRCIFCGRSHLFIGLSPKVSLLWASGVRGSILYHLQKFLDYRSLFFAWCHYTKRWKSKFIYVHFWHQNVLLFCQNHIHFLTKKGINYM